MSDSNDSVNELFLDSSEDSDAEMDPPREVADEQAEPHQRDNQRTMGGRNEWQNPDPLVCYFCVHADQREVTGDAPSPQARPRNQFSGHSTRYWVGGAGQMRMLEEVTSDTSSLIPWVSTGLTQANVRHILDVAILADFRGVADLLDLHHQLGARERQWGSLEGGVSWENTNPCPVRRYWVTPTGQTFKHHAEANAAAFRRHRLHWRPYVTTGGPPVCIFCNGGRSSLIGSRPIPGSLPIPGQAIPQLRESRTRCLQERCECNNNTCGTAPNEYKFALPLHQMDELVKILKHNDNTQVPTQVPVLQMVMDLRDVMVEQQLMIVEWQMLQRSQGPVAFYPGIGRTVPSEYFAIWHLLGMKGIGEGLKLVWKLILHHDETHPAPFWENPPEWWQGCISRDVAQGTQFHRERAQRVDERAFGPNLPEVNNPKPLLSMAGQTFVKNLMRKYPQLRPIVDRLYRDNSL